MSYFKKAKEMKDVAHKSSETIQEVSGYPILAIPERNLTKETCEVFGVRTAVDPKDGKTPIAHYFPYHDNKGKLTGYKKRDITVPKDDPYHFTTVGSVKISSGLFGQSVAEKVDRKRSKLLVCEGEWDCMSAYQSLVESVKGTKYNDLKPQVVSVGMGTKNAVEHIIQNKDFVSTFDLVVAVFDNDECTPKEREKGVVKGKEATAEVAGALLPASIHYVPFEHNMKDCSDYLVANRSADLAKLLSFGTRPYVAEKIVHACDIPFEEVIADAPEGILSEEFELLNKKIHGFRKRELVLLTAPSGVGKSTISSFFSADFENAGEKVGQIFLEERNKETLQRLIAKKLKVNFIEFKNRPTSVATPDQIRRAYDEIVAKDSVIMLGHFGSLPITELMSKIKHLHYVEGCGYIVLDHISLVVSGSQVADERKELDMVMTELASFCAANDVGIIVISHINRTGADGWKPPKGKEDQPFWVRVRKEELRGSASLEQLAWIILALEPEVMPDRTRGRVRLVVLKNRTWSYLGEADTFTLDDDDWSVVLDKTDSEY